ncbi:copper chaperone [Erysipelothrix sp. HDW6C]|uniref:copper chaperone n=1 Tax=Erysipelothrix sp. HDW6C TaxID=2714930 RepID=UPI00140D1E51|nr:copper chaperone [Erysipelothrix sp. HDW6C]QIK69624.1 copper chaperone [Erysipelothrix sp. HDW6C]
MKHIIFVKDLDTEEAYKKVAHEMDNTRIEYSISLGTSSVTVSGSNDVVYTAKQAIIQAGFIVQ